MKPPVELRRLLLNRIVWIALGSLALAIPALWWQARNDIRTEAVGAGETAALFSRLLALQNSRGEELESRLAALTESGVSAGPRHLTLVVADESGRTVASTSPAQSVFAETILADALPATQTSHATWIQTGDGRKLHVTLTSNPASEASEAITSLMDLVLWFALYTLLLVAGMTLAVHRAFAPLRHIVEKMADCLSQNYTARLPAFSVRELDLIGRSLNHLAESLAKAEASRRALSLKMVSVQEEERSRLVQELHDEFGQRLTAMRASTAYLVRTTESHTAARTVAEELAGQCQQLHDGIRELLQQMRPHATANGPVPLTALIDKLLHSWQQMPGQEIRFSSLCELEDARLPSSLSLALYRMTQEALTNAVRHASARHIEVGLKLTGDWLHWRVSDDGQGIAQAEAALERGNGLAGLRERVWAHGGQFLLSPGPDGRGLVLAATFGLSPQPLVGANSPCPSCP